MVSLSDHCLQRCTAQACIGGTAFAGRWMILGHSPPSGL